MPIDAATLASKLSSFREDLFSRQLTAEHFTYKECPEQFDDLIHYINKEADLCVKIDNGYINYWLGDITAFIMATALPHLKYVQTLKLENIKTTSKGAIALANVISWRPLKELHLNDNLIDDDGAKHLAPLLEGKVPKLRVLSLVRNKLSPLGESYFNNIKPPQLVDLKPKGAEPGANNYDDDFPPLIKPIILSGAKPKERKGDRYESKEHASSNSHDAKPNHRLNYKF